MKATYLWLSRAIAVGVVLQAAFVAWGTYDIFHAAADDKPFTSDTESYVGQSLHSVFGMGVIPLLVLAMLIVAFFAGVRGGVRLAAIALGLVVLQIVLGMVSFGAPVIGLLHGVNAFALAGVAGFAGSRANKPPAGTAGPPDPERAPATA